MAGPFHAKCGTYHKYLGADATPCPVRGVSIPLAPYVPRVNEGGVPLRAAALSTGSIVEFTDEEIVEFKAWKVRRDEKRERERLRMQRYRARKRDG